MHTRGQQVSLPGPPLPAPPRLRKARSRCCGPATGRVADLGLAIPGPGVEPHRARLRSWHGPGPAKQRPVGRFAIRQFMGRERMRMRASSTTRPTLLRAPPEQPAGSSEVLLSAVRFAAGSPAAAETLKRVAGCSPPAACPSRCPPRRPPGHRDRRPRGSRCRWLGSTPDRPHAPRHALPRSNWPRIVVKGSHQPRTSSRMTQRQLPLPHRSRRIPKCLRHILSFQPRQVSHDLRRGHPVGHHRRHHSGHRDPQPTDTRLPGHLVRLDGDAIENHTSSVEPDRSARPRRSQDPLATSRTHKRAKRGRSGAVRPVNWGLIRTAAVKIKNRYAQVNGHFHAQSGTCPASLPSWPCRFDPGHPLHRKPVH